ncbi:mucin-2-like [Pseudophryne corroboree]|uniref:mucin-2-like n=1 Tax=Pseudophryne corroboree TaxID=495146 RepID=UPI003081B737
MGTNKGITKGIAKSPTSNIYGSPLLHIENDVPSARRNTYLNYIYVNARSLTAKKGELEILATSIQYDIIGITETWWDESHDWSIYMEGYKLFRRDRSNKRGGGVCLYLKQFLKPDVRKDIHEENVNTVEMLWVEITCGGKVKKKIVVGLCYKPPGINISDEEMLLKQTDKAAGAGDVIVMGDFNYPERNWINDSCDTARGYTLSCTSCSGTTATLCTGSAIACPSGADACSTTYTETQITAFGLKTISVERGCGYLSECEQPKSLSNQFMTVNINIGCCTVDNCTAALPTVFTGNAAANGFQCPSCFTLTAETCVPDSNISCTGNETRCTSYSMSSADAPYKPIMAMSGCATPSLCSNYTGTTSTEVTGQIKIGIKCNNAPVSTGSQNNTTPSSTVSPNTNSESVSVNTPAVTKANTPAETKANTPAETKANTPAVTKVNTPAVTKANTPAVTKANTPAETKVNTPAVTKVNTPAVTSNSHAFTETGTSSHLELTSGGNKVTSLPSSRTESQSYHFTTDIANSYPSNSTVSQNNYTTRVTFTPIVLHSTTREPATSCCVCNGSINRGFNLCLILILILPLIKCLH